MKLLPAAVIMAALCTLCLPACAPKIQDCDQVDLLCAGLVTDLNGVNDQTFNLSAWEALRQAYQDGLVDQIDIIETADSQDYAKNIRTLADLGYDIIVTSGFDLGEETMAAAYEYPQILFIAVNQSASDFTPKDEETPENYSGLTCPEDQAGFMAGALAAMLTKTSKVGAVCASSELWDFFQYCEGFRSGVAYVDQEVTAAVVYHDHVSLNKTSADPAWGTTTALSLMTQGVDVIFGAGGETGTGALEAAAQYDTPAIGIETDQSTPLPGVNPPAYSSIGYQLFSSLYALIEFAAQGDFPGGDDYTGSVYYTLAQDLQGEIPADDESRLRLILSGLRDGSIETNVPAPSD